MMMVILKNPFRRTKLLIWDISILGEFNNIPFDANTFLLMCSIICLLMHSHKCFKNWKAVSKKNESRYQIKNTNNIEYIGIFTDQIFEKFKHVLDHTVQ